METLNINQKINIKGNYLALAYFPKPKRFAAMILYGYEHAEMYCPSILIPKQHLEFREPKRNPLLIN